MQLCDEPLKTSNPGRTLSFGEKFLMHFLSEWFGMCVVVPGVLLQQDPASLFSPWSGTMPPSLSFKPWPSLNQKPALTWANNWYRSKISKNGDIIQICLRDDWRWSLQIPMFFSLGGMWPTREQAWTIPSVSWPLAELQPWTCKLHARGNTTQLPKKVSPRVSSKFPNCSCFDVPSLFILN